MIESERQDKDLLDIQARVVLIKIGLLMIIALLGLRIWQLQVRDGYHYQELARDNRTRSIHLKPARGQLYDRTGRLLANNVPSFNLYVSLEDVPDRNALIQQLRQYLNLDEHELEQQLSRQTGNRRTQIKSGLTLKEAALIETHRMDLPGVVIQPEYQRNYLLAGYASHLIGYVGEVSEEQLNQEEFHDLQLGSVVGQYGIERTYDQYLRGRAGRELIEVDAFGHKKRSISAQKPTAGDDLYLTIDFRLQQLSEDLLGQESGAIVALHAPTGEVLALASRPSFDPNALSRGISTSQWQALMQDSRHPLTNRAIQGQYPPGSTFKIIMAAAALDTQTMAATDRITCKGGFQFGRRRYRDWKRGGHGPVDLVEALEQSCDVYFYKVGNRMGIETIAEYARRFGLGENTGIDLPAERSGLVPSPAWKEKVKQEPWYPGETISVSIGQGYLMATPIQMAQVISAVATNGHVHPPRVLRARRVRRTGALVEPLASPRPPLTLSPRTFSQIKAGLAAVVTDGTAQRIKSDRITIAGKTGTAQVVTLRSEGEKETPKEFRDHAWFVAYAPIDKPEIAVSVLVEHMGHGGSAAAPLAKELIEAYFYPPAGPEIPQEAKEGSTINEPQPVPTHG